MAATKHRFVGPRLAPDQLNRIKMLATTARGLSIDAVQKAKSGHPGLPLGMADVAAVLWARHLKHNPLNPRWPDRDRFVLSAGHGSMLLYSLLHLSGYDLPLAELQNFRQLGSKTPGHPEYGLTPGVETTTGPLGQGIANAVGMAMAERWLATRFNRPGYRIVDHHTYVIASDGDLMEGISHEACALAGHLRLHKLIVLWDDNRISIDGPTDLTFSEDVLTRFKSYGWQIHRIDGHDLFQIDSAIEAAREQTSRPSLIACRTTIGYGSPNRAGSAKAHGEPLGEEEAVLTKRTLGLPEDRTFFIPPEISGYQEAIRQKGKELQARWEEAFREYTSVYRQAGKEFSQIMEGRLADDWQLSVPYFKQDTPLATRAASGTVLAELSARIPQLLGGSADLSGSNNTRPAGEKHLTREDFSGRYIHFGVREHGMGAILNGLALHGGVIPYGGTFLVFSDYMRPAIRMAALMHLPVIYVFTHDSIGLGEDGPTHQPIEHLTALRAIPNLVVIRPADANETAVAWQVALQRKEGPTALILTRQKLPVLDREKMGYAPAAQAAKGGYVIATSPNPQAALIATGSELHIALKAYHRLMEKGVHTQVISMPSSELFDAQSSRYREAVLPDRLSVKVAIEAGVPLFWYKYLGRKGAVVGMHSFGASAPYQKLYEHFGITTEAVEQAVLRKLENA